MKDDGKPFVSSDCYSHLCEKYGRAIADATVEATEEQCLMLIRQNVILRIVVKGLLIVTAALAGSMAALVVG